jgi:hypothetical protein
MKHIVRKAYWDFEKEEKWLNEMSAKGMALTDYSWWRYVFIETSNNEYTYRIELLENKPTHAESIAYIRFLEENGVECVATYSRWIFLRKKSSEGSFDIYSDIDSKIKHYKRVYVSYNTVTWVEFTAGLINLIIGVVNLNIGYKLGNFTTGNLIIGISLTLLGLFFLRLGLPIKKKIKSLQLEKAIRE